MMMSVMAYSFVAYRRLLKAALEFKPDQGHRIRKYRKP